LLGVSFVHEDPADGDAALSAETKRARDGDVDGIVDVAVLGDDDPAVAAQLERDLLTVGARLEPPAYLGAGEREAADALVLDKRGRVVVAAGEDAQCLPRESGLQECPAQP